MEIYNKSHISEIQQNSLVLFEPLLGVYEEYKSSDWEQKHLTLFETPSGQELVEIYCTKCIH